MVGIRGERQIVGVVHVPHFGTADDVLVAWPGFGATTSGERQSVCHGRRACPGGDHMPGKENPAERIGEIDLPFAERGKAVRAVASASADADECRMLLEMLGLKPHQGRQLPLTDGRLSA
jgi:hypothetical protein